MERLEYPIRVAICGMGNRGKDTYAPISESIPEQMQIVAIAEPDEGKRAYCRERYRIPEEMCFETGEEMFAREKLADVAFICTQDQQHVVHAVAALRQGYHLLLEKPIATRIEDVQLIERTAKEMNRRVVVCHVLRYAPFFETIRAAIERGDVGDVVCIQTLENVGYWHQAHSFVRGNWRNEAESTFMLLAKCCHDIDYLVWLCGGQACKRVSSFGSLRHFRKECAPEGAAPRCTAGCKAKENCPYDAEKIYLTSEQTGVLHGHTGWPCEVLALEPTEQSIREAIEHGPYGRCVYACDNDVVDNQIVNMEMEDGTHCQLMMTAFTAHGGRTIRVLGTHGAIEGDMDANTLSIQPFGKPRVEIDVSKIGVDLAGHGGGDARMVAEYLRLLHEGAEPGGRMSTLAASAESHYIAFAAERSRRNGGMAVEVESVRAQRQG
ncbi:MAG: Gfo/Idh/MocA family oxidoreductase [Clostridia bacterium]|nr:Gfo/Idh/MocA family oxidoreductase [Clostridia bacterium]